MEVIDLRSLVPLDRETILESVSKTGRLVVVDEDYRSFGLSGEVVATVTDADPRLLRAPCAGWPCPTCRSRTPTSLEYAVLPRQERIEEAVRRAVGHHDRRPVSRRCPRRSPDGRGRARHVVRRRGREPCTADQLLAEVQVDKVAAEVVAPVAGVVHLLVDEDGRCPQGVPDRPDRLGIPPFSSS